MVFIIQGRKYDTEKMEFISSVEKWYEFNSSFLSSFFEAGVGRTYKCDLYKSKKGNWMLTHEADSRIVAEAISEKEAKNLLIQNNPNKYEELFEEIPEA